MSATANKKILLLTLQGIGDTILTMPIFEAMHTRGYSVDAVLSDNGSAQILGLFPWINRVYLWNEKLPVIFNLCNLFLRLRAHHYCEAYGLCPSGRRENILLRFSNAKIKWGWRTRHPWRVLLDFKSPKMPLWNEQEHRLRSNQILFKLSDEEMSDALAHIKKRCRPDQKNDLRLTTTLRIGIQPLTKSPRRCWDQKTFSRVINTLRKSFDLEITLFGGNGEGEALTDIYSEIFSAGKTKICSGSAWGEVVREIEGQDFFLGVDSCLAHLAAITGVPTCVLFGYTVPEQTGALGPHVLILQSEIDRMEPYQFHQRLHDGDSYGLHLREDQVTEVVTLFLRRLAQDPVLAISTSVQNPLKIDTLPFGACRIVLKSDSKIRL